MPARYVQPMPAPPSSGSSLTEDVYERLRADLLSCRILPDTHLRIAELCTRFGVSLSAVREALARLTAEQLVVARPQRGFRVAPISTAELCDVTQVRTRIECACLELAITHGDLDWETDLVAALHRLSRTPESDPGGLPRMNEGWAAAHSAFHDGLASGCNSPWMLRLRRMLYDQSERYRRLSVPLADHGRDVQGEHRAIVEAAIARDAPRATSLLSEHLAHTTRILLQQSWPGLDVEQKPQRVKARAASTPLRA